MTDEDQLRDFHGTIEHDIHLPLSVVEYEWRVPAGHIHFCVVGDFRFRMLLYDNTTTPVLLLPALGLAQLTSLSLTLRCLSVERQAISYSAILSGEHCVVADQTGSGKTLAYLAPLVQRLRYVWCVAARAVCFFGSVAC